MSKCHVYKDIYSKYIVKYGKVDQSVFFEAALDALDYKKHEGIFRGSLYPRKLLLKTA